MKSISTENSPNLGHWLSGLLLGLFLAPSLFVVYLALSSWEFGGLLHLTGTVLPGYFLNTLWLALMTLAVALVVGVGSAFLVAFFSFPGRRWVEVLLVLPLAMPSYLVAIVYREMAHRSPWFPAVEPIVGAAMILAVTLYPLIYLLARTAFRSQAMGFIEIGSSLGLDRWRITSRALLPLATPAILLALLLVLVETVSDFGTVSVLGVSTLTTAVYRIWFGQFDPGLAAQVSLLGALFPLMLVLGYGWLTRGRRFVNPTNRPQSAILQPLSRVAGYSALVLCMVPVVLGFLLPLAILLQWASTIVAQFELQRLYPDLLQTLLLAGSTMLIALVTGCWLALSARWKSSRGWSLGTLWILCLNYAMPAIVLAVILLYLSGWVYHTPAGEWLSNSIALVVLAGVLRYTGFTYFSIESGLQGISTHVDDAVAATGRNRWYGVRRVLLPMLRAPLTVAAMLVFLIVAKDLTLSLVLQPFGFGSLALSVYYFADIDAYAPAAMHALCLLLVLVYPVLSLNRWLEYR
jgi:iron(III) transport system permease protein